MVCICVEYVSCYPFRYKKCSKNLDKVIKGRRGNPVKDQLSDKREAVIDIVCEGPFSYEHLCDTYEFCSAGLGELYIIMVYTVYRTTLFFRIKTFHGLARVSGCI